MLESYKKTYEECANIIPDWRKLSKSALVNKYIEHEPDKKLANAYMSAIICRYWGALNKYYNSSYKSATVEDCYDWLIYAIMYAIKQRKWLDPNNKLFNDPNGPDKVINRVIISVRLGFFQNSNTAKRKGNFGNSSLETMLEDLGDAAPIPVYEEKDLDSTNIDIKNMIVDAFNNKEYLLAFMLDGIINYDPFDKETGKDGYLYTQFNVKKLAHHLRTLDDKYCYNFSKAFKLPTEDVQHAVVDCKSLPRLRLYNGIKKNIRVLSKSKALALID